MVELIGINNTKQPFEKRDSCNTQYKGLQPLVCFATTVSALIAAATAFATAAPFFGFF